MMNREKIRKEFEDGFNLNFEDNKDLYIHWIEQKLIDQQEKAKLLIDFIEEMKK